MTQSPPVQSSADMYENIFDTHAHYNDEAFNDDRDELLSSLPSKGVANIINCGTTYKTSVESMKIAEKYPFAYFAAGIHPEDCGELDFSEVDRIKELLTHEKCVAIGEIGLDYHYTADTKEKQLIFFEKQLLLANEYDIPVIIHDRDAHGDTMELLKKHKPKGVLHCFSGSVETMKEAVSLGLYIGLGGAVTFKNARKPLEVSKEVPSDRLLLETDCPYMAPVPFRGKRNDSSLIAYVAEVIAEARGTKVQEIIDNANRNAKKLFSTINN